MNEEILLKSIVSLMKTMNTLTETQSAIAQSLNSLNDNISAKSFSEVKNTESFIFEDEKNKEFSNPILKEWQELVNKPLVIPENVTITDTAPSTHYVPKFSNLIKKTLLPNSLPNSGDFVGFGEVK